MLHNVFECMHATMEHQERPCDETSRCINDVTKRWCLLYWFVWGKCQGTLSIIYFYTVECASCAEALNKPTKVFLHAYWLCILLSYTKNGQTKLEALYCETMLSDK